MKNHSDAQRLQIRGTTSFLRDTSTVRGHVAATLPVVAYEQTNTSQITAGLDTFC